MTRHPSSMTARPMPQNLPPPAVHLTDLEARLAQADGEQTQTALMARLAETEWRVRNQMAASVPRDQYALYATVADALARAKEVLTTWPVNDQAVVHSSTGLPVPALQPSITDNRSI